MDAETRKPLPIPGARSFAREVADLVRAESDRVVTSAWERTSWIESRLAPAPWLQRALGQDVACAVVSRAGASLTPRQLQEFAKARLAEFKVPRQILFLGERPKVQTGKLQRIGLPEKLGLLRVERVGVHDTLAQLGGDSLLAAQAINRIGETTNVDMALLDPLCALTVAEVAEKIARSNQT